MRSVHRQDVFSSGLAEVIALRRATFDSSPQLDKPRDDLKLE